MPINVSEAIDNDTAVIVMVRRKTGGAFNDGLWVEGSESTFKMLSSVQQPTPKQLEYIPSGDRAKDVKAFYCNKPVRSNDDKLNIEADRLYHRGQWYKVIHSGDWNDYGWYFALGVRENGFA